MGFRNFYFNYFCMNIIDIKIKLMGDRKKNNNVDISAESATNLATNR